MAKPPIFPGGGCGPPIYTIIYTSWKAGKLDELGKLGELEDFAELEDFSQAGNFYQYPSKLEQRKDPAL